MGKAVEERVQPGMSGLQKGLLALLVLALLASVGVRAWQARERSDAAAVPPGTASLAEGGARDAGAEPASPLERWLPYVTEGSFFGLLGFALGYATRKFVKLGLILVALFFLGLQALVWTGTVSVDWSGMLGKLNALLFNLKENESMTAFLTRRIPSAGGMLAGYLIGFQRG